MTLPPTVRKRRKSRPEEGQELSKVKGKGGAGRFLQFEDHQRHVWDVEAWGLPAPNHACPIVKGRMG